MSLLPADDLRRADGGSPPHPAEGTLGFEHFCRLFLTRYCRLVVRGALPAIDGPFLICSNHRSHLDSVAIMTALSLPFASCGLLAAQDYFFREPFRLKLLARLLRLIPIERGPRSHGFKRTMAACTEFLAGGGGALLAYPEGTRRPGPGLSRFKRGPALLALALGLPILPVYVSGTGAVLPKRRLLPRPGEIIVTLGEPIDCSASMAPLERRLQSFALAALIEDNVRALAAELGE